MRTIIVSALVAITILVTGCGAEKEALEAAKGSMSTGSEKGITVTVPHTSLKTAQDNWEERLEDQSEDVYVYKNEVYSDNARIPSIQDGTIDLLSTFSEGRDGVVQVTTKIDLGGALLSEQTHKEKYRSANIFLQNLAAQVSRTSLEASQKEAAKELKKLEKQEKELNREIQQSQQELKELQEKLRMERERNEQLRRQLEDN